MRHSFEQVFDSSRMSGALGCLPVSSREILDVGQSRASAAATLPVIPRLANRLSRQAEAAVGHGPCLIALRVSRAGVLHDQLGTLAADHRDRRRGRARHRGPADHLAGDADRSGRVLVPRSRRTTGCLSAVWDGQRLHGLPTSQNVRSDTLAAHFPWSRARIRGPRTPDLGIRTPRTACRRPDDPATNTEV